MEGSQEGTTTEYSTEPVIHKRSLGGYKPTKRKANYLTEKQEKFADGIAGGLSNKDAVVQAYGEEVGFPSQFGYALRNKPSIQRYLMDTAGRCAEIQMEMIESSRTPAAVRNDAIKFRLTSIGIGEQEEATGGINIGDIHINVLPSNHNNGGTQEADTRGVQE